MRAASLSFLVCLIALGCSVRTTGLGPRDAEPGIDSGPRDGTIDSRPPSDATDTTDTGTTDALVPPPPVDAGTDAGPLPPPDSGPPPMTDAGPPPGSAGDACARTSDCSPGLYCFVESWLPGGYCSRSCSSDVECGPSAGCGNFSGYRYCARRCSSSTHCRPGYYCGSGYCLPY